jgi:branched-chain amino acid aminotransferase
MDEVIYLNGEFVPTVKVRISPFDHGFLYGYGLFETMRSYNGIIFRLEKHLERLQKAALVLDLSSRMVSFNLEKACYDLLAANRLSDARIRLMVTAGEGDMVPNPASCKGITVFIVARKLVPVSPESYARGYRVITASLRRNSLSPLSRLKTSCYLENIIARQEARAAGADEALVLNEQGLLAEASSSNVSLVTGGCLLTPALDCGALPGITRDAVLELAAELGIETMDTVISRDTLCEAGEAFLTNSIIELMPLTAIDNKPVGTGKPGPLTLRLTEAYRKLVASYKRRE